MRKKQAKTHKNIDDDAVASSNANLTVCEDESHAPEEKKATVTDVPGVETIKIVKNGKEQNFVSCNVDDSSNSSAIVLAPSRPRFSIVIPCYNNAGYVVRCLRSIKNQTFDLAKVQVIAVNDASTDGSGDILALIGNEIPNFTLINNDKNLGVGASRNTAASRATGKYVYFMDCDDYLTSNALERINDALTKANDPDVAFIPFLTLEQSSKPIHKPAGTNIINAIASCPPGPWSKVFKLSLFTPFPVGFRGEDTVWHFVQVDKFNSFCNVPGDDPCYMYDRTNASAITDTLVWSAQNALTLEHLAKENDAIKAGKNDKFFSDILRALAEMYDSRHSIAKSFVKSLWFARFASIYQGIVSGHFHN